MLTHNVSTSQSISSIKTATFHATFSASCVRPIKTNSQCVGVEIQGLSTSEGGALKSGDLITMVNGVSVASPNQFFKLLRIFPTDHLAVTVMRSGTRFVVGGPQIQQLVNAVRSQPAPPTPPIPPKPPKDGF